eukprot:TRINITY_DN1879_c0_g1_i2.p1 TRINITY_DN1879_c0_g1~~TRINITY_DN1879_c0_g1_i2.p1  ORF type:complete len:395 (+),score=92.77 TRINITY_DN1879_c0_g1_i2:344-1528(+)
MDIEKSSTTSYDSFSSVVPERSIERNRNTVPKTKKVKDPVILDRKVKISTPLRESAPAPKPAGPRKLKIDSFGSAAGKRLRSMRGPPNMSYRPKKLSTRSFAPNKKYHKPKPSYVNVPEKPKIRAPKKIKKSDPIKMDSDFDMPDFEPNTDVKPESNFDINSLFGDSWKDDLPKSEKKKKDYKRESIAPTALSMKIDALDPNQPLTLPFIDPKFLTEQQQVVDIEGDLEKMVDKQGVGGTYISKKEESTSIAAALFQNTQGKNYGEDDLFFIQLPSGLPSTLSCSRSEDEGIDIDSEQPTKKKGIVRNRPNFESTITKLSGKIGKIYILKSGKVKMLIGDVVFDITQGMPCNFMQEVVGIDKDDLQFYQLGELNKRMVVFPDIDNILKNKNGNV